MTRMAISPRLATRTLVNRGGEDNGTGEAGSPAVAVGRRCMSRRSPRRCSPAAPTAQAALPRSSAAVGYGFSCAHGERCRSTAAAQVPGPGSLYVERRPRLQHQPSAGRAVRARRRARAVGHATPFDGDGLFGLRPATRNRDMIVFDQRGTGRSGAAALPRARARHPARRRTRRPATAPRGSAPGAPSTPRSDTVDDIEAVRARARRRQDRALRRLVRDQGRARVRAALPGQRRAAGARLGRRARTAPHPLPVDTYAAVPRVAAVALPRRLLAIHEGPGGRPASGWCGGWRPARCAAGVVDSRGRRRTATLSRGELFTLLLAGDFDPDPARRLPRRGRGRP